MTSASEGSGRPATPRQCQQMIELLAETLTELAQLVDEDPDRYRELLESGREDIEAMRESVRKHPQDLADAMAQIELNELMQDERFRESLEQMRRGERGEWPNGFVSAKPGEDWDPED